MSEMKDKKICYYCQKGGHEECSGQIEDKEECECSKCTINMSISVNNEKIYTKRMRR